MGWWTDALNSNPATGAFTKRGRKIISSATQAATSSNDRKIGNVVDDITGENQAIASRDAAKDLNRSTMESNAMLDKWHQQGREDMQPWMEAGKQNLGTLQSLMGQGAFDMPDENLEGPAYNAPQFNASQYPIPGAFGAFDPNSVKLDQDPGYQYRLAQGEKGLMRGAAKMGGFASGSTLQGLMGLNQEMGSQEYGNAFNRAFDSYGANRDTHKTNIDRAIGERDFGYGMNFDDRAFGYGQHQDQYQGRLNNFQRRAGNKQDRFNRLSGLSNMGQQTAGTLSNLGQQFATGYGQNAQAGANALASGRIGAANANSQFYNNLLNLGGQLGAGYLAGRGK